MKSRKRVIILSILSILMAFLFFGFSELSKKFHSINSNALKLIDNLKNLENQLDNEILKSSFFLFYDYDNIALLIKEIEKNIQEIENLDMFKSMFPKSYKSLLKYKKLFSKEKEKINRYISINSIMKNSQIYIPSLALKYLRLRKGRIDLKYFKVLVETVSTVFLLKNSLDSKYIKKLKYYKAVLENYGNLLPSKEEKSINKAFLMHIDAIIMNFTEYKTLVNKLLKKNHSIKFLNEISIIFIEESEEKAKVFSLFSIISGFIFVSFISYISLLLIKIDRQNLKLKILTDFLEKSLRTDELTGLPNRIAFNEDIKKYKKPTLILINIDNFKSINDVYGNKIGDLLLISIGNILKEFLKDKNELSPKVYRLGADDFGILIENHQSTVVNLAEEIINKIENQRFEIQNFIIFITVSVGISYEEPLFENADLALKKAKTSRERIIIYSKDLDTKKQLENNLKVINLVKYALENDKVLLYFQPIVNNKNNKIEEYEVLFRIQDENGNIITPGEILPVIKETKYYRYLTEKILSKAFKTLETYRDIVLSVNISYEDIADDYIKNSIILNQCSSRNIKGRLVFEILESESIRDFESVRQFVNTIRECGLKFAIDDFGSGYSNFIYLAELKPDLLKIDGSLIREIHKKQEHREIVETINNFAHSLGIKTIAEFVHSEEVFKVVKEIGIDYSQGFYIGKPSPKIKH